MRSRRFVCTVLGVAGVVCTACSAPSPALQPPPLPDVHVESFPGAAGVLAGFAPDDDEPMRVGDAALLGLEIHRDGAIDRQLLLIEVADLKWIVPEAVRIDGAPQPVDVTRVRLLRQFTVNASRQTLTEGAPDGQPVVERRTLSVTPIDVRLTRFDAAGRPLAASVATLYEEPLSTGFWPYASSDGDVVASDYAIVLTISMQELAANDEVLQDLLFRVVDPPSVWSIATHLGVELTLRWQPGDARAAPVVVAGFAGELRKTSLELVVNGNVATSVTMLVTRPGASLRACGGLVGAVAQHPSDEGRFAVVRLLATRRGAP